MGQEAVRVKHCEWCSREVSDKDVIKVGFMQVLVVCSEECKQEIEAELCEVFNALSDF